MKTDLGQNVYLIGEDRSLGKWDVSTVGLILTYLFIDSRGKKRISFTQAKNHIRHGRLPNQSKSTQKMPKAFLSTNISFKTRILPKSNGKKAPTEWWILVNTINMTSSFT